jgi:hypothetical protein
LASRFPVSHGAATCATENNRFVCDRLGLDDVTIIKSCFAAAIKPALSATLQSHGARSGEPLEAE